jgi:protein-L-isoaspartate O-methyltransferase
MMDLKISLSMNVAINENGRFAVVVGNNKQFVVIEIERNEKTNSNQLKFKRKLVSDVGEIK